MGHKAFSLLKFGKIFGSMLVSFVKDGGFFLFLYFKYQFFHFFFDLARYY